VQFVEAAVERLQAVPGMERAAVASDLLLEGVNEMDVQPMDCNMVRARAMKLEAAAGQSTPPAQHLAWM